MATLPHNTPSGVAATGLPSSRRSLLRGLAAAPFVSVPAVALAATAPVRAAHPDAELLALRQRITAVLAEQDAACDRYGRAQTLKFAKLASPDLAAAEAAEIAATQAWSDLRDEIGQMPANTLEGLRVKVTCGYDIWDDDYIMESVVLDILAMTGGDA